VIIVPDTVITNRSDLWVNPTSILACIGLVVVSGVVGAVIAKDNTTQIMGFCSMICVSLFTLLQTKQASNKAERASFQAGIAANLVQENSVNTEQKLQHLTDVAVGVKKTGESIYKLVNSASGHQLGLYASLARRMANITGDQEDVAVAEKAELMYHDHEAKQREVEKVGGAPDQHGSLKEVTP
jgi:hypothetical protein